MPTFLDFAGLKVPAEVRGHSLVPVLERDAPVRDGLILGMFGGPISAVDGRYSYFLYPEILTGEGLHEYTLQPAHMMAPFEIKEFEGAELSAPFDFTKGVQGAEAQGARRRQAPARPGRHRPSRTPRRCSTISRAIPSRSGRSTIPRRSRGCDP